MQKRKLLLWTDKQTERQTWKNQYTLLNFVGGFKSKDLTQWSESYPYVQRFMNLKVNNSLPLATWCTWVHWQMVSVQDLVLTYPWSNLWTHDCSYLLLVQTDPTIKLKKCKKVIERHFIQEIFFTFFALWPEGEFKTGQIYTCIIVYKGIFHKNGT